MAALLHGLGARRQLPDRRDQVMDLGMLSAPLPAVVGVDPKFIPPVRDQRQLGSCTAFGVTASLWSTYEKEGYHNPFNPSELFHYYNTRSLEGSTGFDAGAGVRDSFKAAAKWGMCAEHWWPYADANPGPFTQQPPQDAYANASKHLLIAYKAVPQTRAAIRDCLAQGYGVVIGFGCYDGIFDPSVSASGLVPLPRAGARLLGGHCVFVVDADDVSEQYRFQNSWGAGWGLGGFGAFPYAYLEDASLAFDFWTARRQK